MNTIEVIAIGLAIVVVSLFIAALIVRSRHRKRVARLAVSSPVGFSGRLRELFRRDSADAILADLEGVLLEADVGPRLTAELMRDLTSLPRDRQAPEALRRILKEKLAQYVRAHPASVTQGQLQALLILGVNGVGKTTTIAKLAHYFKSQRLNVIAIAGDTFRAAAIAQLQVWGTRVGVEVIAQSSGADPGAVIFDGLSAARARGADIALIDTAGRLHTKAPLVDELKKIDRVMRKFDAALPRQTYLVLDSTTGQNGLQQAKVFSEALHIDAAILTKWDGSAKGGVLFAIGKELGLPIAFIGVGERMEDLKPFDPQAFVEGLL